MPAFDRNSAIVGMFAEHRAEEVATGDRRRDQIIQRFLDGLNARGCNPAPGDVQIIIEGAAQIQAAADLLFHGAPYATQEVVTGHDSLVERFCAELIVAEIMDHGFDCEDRQGNLCGVDRTVAKDTTFITVVRPTPSGGCRRCVECEGEEHHWMFVGDVDDAGEPVEGCKHCDATRPLADSDEDEDEDE